MFITPHFATQYSCTAGNPRISNDFRRLLTAAVPQSVTCQYCDIQ